MGCTLRYLAVSRPIVTISQPSAAASKTNGAARKISANTVFTTDDFLQLIRRPRREKSRSNQLCDRHSLCTLSGGRDAERLRSDRARDDSRNDPGACRIAGWLRRD